MLIRLLPVYAGLAPIVGVAVAYWLGVTNEVLPACIPIVDGCTSISATGRYMPGSLIFRAVMFPQAIVLVFLWYFAACWLRNIAPASKMSGTVMIAGFVGALALILYVTFLGTKAPFYEFMRRFGIYFYFLGTVVAQLALATALFRHFLKTASPLLKRYAIVMLWLSGLPFALGVLMMFLKTFIDDPSSAENRIEWLSALIMQIYFIVMYFAWRSTGYTVLTRTD